MAAMKSPSQADAQKAMRIRVAFELSLDYYNFEQMGKTYIGYRSIVVGGRGNETSCK